MHHKVLSGYEQQFAVMHAHWYACTLSGAAEWRACLGMAKRSLVEFQ